MLCWDRANGVDGEWSIEQMSGFYESVLQGFQAGAPPVSPEFWLSEEDWWPIAGP